MTDEAGDVALVIPTDLAAEMREIARRDHRPTLDVVRDAVEAYLEVRRSGGPAPSDGTEDHQPSAEYREVMRDKIAAGMRSLREGKGVDGEAFFAAMDSELELLERQGQ
jgi:predicted transcriptional regulator